MTIENGQLAVDYLGRSFGYDKEKAIFSQKIPAIFLELSQKIEAQSALLSLDTIVREDILAAYGSDLSLLDKYREEFENFVVQVISISITEKKVESSKDKPFWQEVFELLPEKANQPLLDFDFELASQSTAEMLKGLRKNFHEGLLNLMKRFACIFHIMVEHEYIGIFEQTAEQVGRYHFFRREKESELVSQKSHDEISIEGDQEKITTTTVKGIRHHIFLERHIHHVMNLKIKALDQTSDGMPDKIQKFVTGLPNWIREMLRIVEGDLIKKEILKKVDKTSLEIKKEVESKYLFDPAICLGDFCLLGWTASDIAAEKVEKAEKESEKYFFSIVFASIILLLFAIWGGVTFFSNLDERNKQAFLATLPKEAVVKVVHYDEVFELPGDIEYIYRGVGVNNFLRFCSKEKINGTWHLIFAEVKDQKSPSSKWGDVDLSDKLGYPMKLKVISYNNTEMQYVVVEE